MRVKWLREARANLDAEAEYITQDSPAAAGRMVEAIVSAVAGLARHPAVGGPGRVVGTRELVVPGTPYVIPYRVQDNTVEVIRVFHGARRWPRKF